MTRSRPAGPARRGPPRSHGAGRPRKPPAHLLGTRVTLTSDSATRSPSHGQARRPNWHRDLGGRGPASVPPPATLETAASVMILFMFTTKNRRGMLAFVLLRMREAYPSMVQSSLRVFATSEPISKISYGSMFRPAASTALMCPLPLIRPMDSQFVLSNVVALYTKARPVDFIQGKVLPRIDSGRDDGHHKEGPKSKPVWSHFVRVTIAGVLELFSRNGLSL